MRNVGVLLCLMACQEAGPTYHQDVAPLLGARCVTCHAEGGIGPFTLDSYEGASDAADLVALVAQSRTMPPWGAETHGMTYADDPSLSDAQITMLEAWAAAGAPEGDPDTPGPELPSLGAELSRVDVTLEMPEAYTPVRQPDDYRCFVLDWPETEDVYVTGFAPRPGNTAIVHHMAAFLFAPNGLLGTSVFDDLEAWDEAEEGPGYTCFGGPSGPNAAQQVPAQQLAQWVPGSGAVVFPEGTGIKVPAGSKIVLQMHYNVPLASGADQSALDVQTAPTVERDASFSPFLDGLWPLGNMALPAGQTTTVSVQRDPRGFADLLVDDNVDIDPGYWMHSVMLHMHRLGQTGTVNLHRASGEVVPLLHVPRYDFDWQLVYRFAEPVRFEDGDEIELACTYNNVTDAEVNWGEGTGDEMCVANFFISEF